MLSNLRLPLLKILPYILVLYGFSISIQTLYTVDPGVPEGLLATAGAWYASQDDLDPYCSEDIMTSLQQRGVDAPEGISFSRSPLSLFLMVPLAIFPMMTWLMIWSFVVLILFWVGIFFITSVCRTPDDRVFLLFILVLLLSFRGPLMSAVTSGLETPVFMLFAGFAVSRGMKSPLSGSALAVHTLFGSMIAPVALAMRSWKSWLAFGITGFVIFISFQAAFGADIWSGYLESMSLHNAASYDADLNLSLSALQQFTGLEGVWARNLIILFSTLILAAQFSWMKGGYKEFIKGPRSSSALFAVLCWWSFLLFPVIHYHHGLLLLPLLPIAERLFGLKRASILIVLTAAWFFLPGETVALRGCRPLLSLIGVHYFAACLPGITD